MWLVVSLTELEQFLETICYGNTPEHSYTVQ